MQTSIPVSTIISITLRLCLKPTHIFPSSATVFAHSTATTSSGNLAILIGEPIN